MHKTPAWKSAVSRYGVALVAVSSALAIRMALAPYVLDQAKFLPFVVAMMVAGWFGGVGPGIFAMVTGALLIDWFFVPPEYSLSLDVKHGIEFSIYGIACLTFLLLVAGLGQRTALRRNQALQAEMEKREQAQRAMRESELRFRTMAETVPDMLFTNQPDGSNDYTNSRFVEFTGHPHDAARGFGWVNCLHPDDRESARRHWLECMVSHEPFSRQYRLKHKSGAWRWCSVRSVPMRDDTGRVVKWMGALTDVHDLNLARDALAQLNAGLELRVAERTAIAEQRAAQLHRLHLQLMDAERRERRRLSRVLHDHIQQLLVAARMRVQMAHRRLDGDSLPQVLAELDDLLSQSIEATRTLTVSLHPPMLEEQGVVPALNWLARQIFEKHRMNVEVSCSESLPQLTIELRVVIFEVARELLFNAVKHAGSREARVTLDCSGPLLRLEVSDSGKGFDFAQCPSFGGDHFGLFSISERLEALGGKLEIVSAPGQGTRVTAHLPLSDTKPTPARNDSKAVPAADLPPSFTI